MDLLEVAPNAFAFQGVWMLAAQEECSSKVYPQCTKVLVLVLVLVLRERRQPECSYWLASACIQE